MSVRLSRRVLLQGLSAVSTAGFCLPAAGQASESPVRYFRIGTGTAGGTYFPIGTAIANVISRPPGALPCERGGSCGVPGLIGVAQSTQGSLQNAEELAAGRLDAALIQADIAHGAYFGKGAYEGKPPQPGFRHLASLHAEAVHVVVRRADGIINLRDLRGRRIAIGETGSGTSVHARAILEAFGLKEGEYAPVRAPLVEAADALRQGRIDALFFTGGYPLAAITALSELLEIALVPVAGEPVRQLRQDFPFFTAGRIPAQAYKDVPQTPTVRVGAQLLAMDRLDADLAFALVRALWHPNSAATLARSHPLGAELKVDNALAGAVVPLHPGAERFYKEAGRL
jgi:hypothetical protein